MSGKGKDNDEQNEEIEDKYQQNDDPNLEYPKFSENKSFADNATKIYDVILEIYHTHRQALFSNNFDLYGSFISLFQPGIEYGSLLEDQETEIGTLIKKEVIRNYLKFGCNIFSLIYNEHSSYHGDGNLIVRGILYFDLQNEHSKFDNQHLYSEAILKKVPIKDFFHGNAFFRTASRQAYKDYATKESIGRIVIHLTQTPDVFWRSPLLSKLIEALLQYDCVVGVKVRGVRDFGRGDSLLIYCNIPWNDAWNILKGEITRIFPLEMREKYHMPFAKSLDVGINGNIPIYIPSTGQLKKKSFTDGLATIARQALDKSLKDNRFKMHSIYDVKMKTQKIRETNIEIFQHYLAEEFLKSGLQVDNDGALYQELEVKKNK